MRHAMQDIVPSPPANAGSDTLRQTSLTPEATVHGTPSVSDKSDIVAFEHKTRQSSGRIGARIDVDSIRPYIRLPDGCVPVHYNFAKVVLAQEKILSNPQ